MKKIWQPRARMAIIAAASFVLLVTVLPQIGSSIGLTSLANRIVGNESCVGSGSSGSGSSGSSSMCCSGSSGSSGSSSSTGQCGMGTVTGTVTVTGAPKKFTPAFLGAGACPTTGPPNVACSNPQYALANNGVYRLSLSPGTWRLDGFYENGPYGGVFLGPAVTVTVTGGETVQQNLTVPYKKPASLHGTITIKNVPAVDPVQQAQILLCPSFAPYNGGNPSIACVHGYGSNGGGGGTTTTIIVGSAAATSAAKGTTFTASYSLTGLPPITWTAYPGYCAQSGCGFNANQGVKFTLSPGGSSTVNVSTNFLLPGESLLTGTVSVTGAPSGFSDEVGVTACPQGGQSGTSFCQTFYGFSGNSYAMVLDAGQWSVKGFYLAEPYDNAVDGPTQLVTLVKKKTTNLYLSVPYQVPGTATGSITVTGIPAGVKVESYTVLACPSTEPWHGGIPAPECVSEYSGPGGYGYGAADRGEAKSANAAANPPAGFAGAAKNPINKYSLPTLTPGTWLLYAGYETALGSATNMTGTSVGITSGKTTTKNLAVRYKQPTQGAVTGTVTVIGAPANGFESGVFACSGLPTAKSCPGQVAAFAEQNGSYTTLLAPGTWWLEGFVDVFGGPGANQSLSPAKKVVLTAGTELTKNFTVTVGAS
jgi:hypothetical protein